MCRSLVLLLFATLVQSACAVASPAAPPNPAAASPSAGPTRKLALLIAVQGYGRFGPEWQNLDGPVNDIVLMRDVLTKRFGFAPAEIEMVCDDAKTCRGVPTRKGIVAAFESLIGRAHHGDLVYIHYSGHGSTVPDVNGDEPGPDGRDSTLVPIDARDTESMEILDDEIAIWLARLGKQTEDVVFVSDSCHSGTITRGAKSSKTRGAPTTDTRDYSWSKQLGDLSALQPPKNFVRVSAARDTQKAYEYEAPNGKSYGRLTWFWAKGLRGAAPGQSYDAVYRSVAAMMPPREQQPVIEGAGDRELFQARFARLPHQIAAVRVNQRQVEFDDGLLSGMTVGSVFEQVSRSDVPVETRTRVRITSVDAYTARGAIEGPGKVREGDLFDEVEHAYKLARLRVSVRADDPKDEAVRKALQGAVATLGDAIEIVPERQHADLILWLARLKDAADGQLECWILDDAEQLYAPDLRIAIGRGGVRSTTEAADGIASVKRDVERIVRNRSILEVASQGLAVLADEVTVDTLRLTDAADGDTGANVVEIPFAGTFSGKPKRQRITRLGTQSGEIELGARNVIAFRVTNHSNRARYFYLVNISPDGTSQVMFPNQGFEDNAKLPAQSAPQLIRDSAVQVDGPRDTYIWFVTETPTNVWALEGKGFEKGRGSQTRGSTNNALAQLLRQAGGLTRGGRATAKGPSDFAARKIVIHVTSPPGP